MKADSSRNGQLRKNLWIENDKKAKRGKDEMKETYSRHGKAYPMSESMRGDKDRVLSMYMDGFALIFI